jgi:hypothetical protein
MEPHGSLGAFEAGEGEVTGGEGLGAASAARARPALPMAAAAQAREARVTIAVRLIIQQYRKLAADALRYDGRAASQRMIRSTAGACEAPTLS